MQPIFESLIESPLLLTDLPEASALETGSLTVPSKETSLNFAQKLGHLYEDALAILLETSTSYDLLERSLQISDPDGPTLGELDFLLRDLRSGLLIHLELATKFYLAVESPEGPLLPGPDARDNFYKKLHRLRTHQLILTEKHRQALPAAYRDETITSRHLIHGCVFDHIDSTAPASPEFVNPHRRQGRWLTVSELDEKFLPGTRCEIIPKPLWPVPLTLFEKVELEEWHPPTSLDRCVMLRIEGEAFPYFVTPVAPPWALPLNTLT